MSLQWQSFDQVDDLNEAAVAYILACARVAMTRQQRFRLVMAGGRSPAVVYKMLRDAEVDWSCWHIYFSDERCVAFNDPRSNSRMARDCLLDHVPIPHAQIHVIPTGLGVDDAAASYGALVQKHTPFDLVLLGVGEDGHTASLFPGQAINLDAWAIAVHSAPKPPASRVSLSVRALRATADVLVMASGEDKRDALESWRRGDPLPIQTVTSGLQGAVMTALPTRR